MTPEQLLIKIKALDLLIDEVLTDITEDAADAALTAMDECWDADRCASMLQDYLEALANALKNFDERI